MATINYNDNNSNIKAIIANVANIANLKGANASRPVEEGYGNTASSAAFYNTSLVLDYKTIGYLGITYRYGVNNIQ